MGIFKFLKDIFTPDEEELSTEEKEAIKELMEIKKELEDIRNEKDISDLISVKVESSLENEGEYNTNFETHKSYPYSEKVIDRFYKNQSFVRDSYSDIDIKSVNKKILAAGEETIKDMKENDKVFHDLFKQGIKRMPLIENYISTLEFNEDFEKAIEICDFATEFGVPTEYSISYEERKECIYKEIDKKKNAKPKKENLPSALATELVNNNLLDEWNISISFGKSTSSNYSRAVFLAKQAPIYDEVGEGKEICHQAIYTSSEKDFLDFIKLYELVGNWKSAFVFVNGNLTNKRDVGDLKYCYGDKCRSGNRNFCFGASEFTLNPFGCHRLQVSLGNHPWWDFGYFKSKNIWKIDKEAILERFEAREKPYSDICPAFNRDRVLVELAKLPDFIDLSKDKRFVRSGDSIFCVKPFV